jgi:hypothetical protein
MSRILIYVEGYTEEGFVRDVLAPHLQSLGILIIPILTTTKFVKNGPNFRGGLSKYEKARQDVLRLTSDADIAAITTMLDYYGLPNDFPGRNSLPKGSCYEKVKYLEEAFRNDIDSRRFIPFLTLHEFEALLFSSPREFDPILPDTDISHRIQDIRNRYSSPEEINDGQDTHPSQRILDLEPSYGKKSDGPRIAARIGLDTIRNECAHFNEWLTKLESFAD